MSRPRAADDFATIRARMEELRREREPAGGDDASQKEARPLRRESDLERRRRRQMEGMPPPWVPTIFIKKPRR